MLVRGTGRSADRDLLLGATSSEIPENYLNREVEILGLVY
jgi:hypothetical protein